MDQNLKNKIEKIINDPNADEKEMLFKLKQLLYENELKNNIARESKSISSLLSENMDQLMDETNYGNVIRTGFIDLDRLIGGFRPGEFIVIGGRPSMGKTQLLINLSLNISKTNPVLYFTYDLSEFLLTSRFISSITGIAIQKILQHNLTDSQKNQLSACGEAFENHQIFLNDSCNYSITSLKAHCEKQIQENGIKVIILDYLQLMSTLKYRNNREFELSYLTREIKNIAKDLNVCVIASSQLSRAVEMRGGSKKPILSDLRESGAIEQDADKVIFIYRPDYYGIDCDEEGNSSVGLTEVILAKNRTGKTGIVKLMRDTDFTNFRDFDGYKSEFSFSEERLDELETPL